MTDNESRRSRAVHSSSLFFSFSSSLVVVVFAVSHVYADPIPVSSRPTRLRPRVVKRFGNRHRATPGRRRRVPFANFGKFDESSARSFTLETPPARRPIIRLNVEEKRDRVESKTSRTAREYAAAGISEKRNREPFLGRRRTKNLRSVKIRQKNRKLLVKRKLLRRVSLARVRARESPRRRARGFWAAKAQKSVNGRFCVCSQTPT